MTAQIVNLTYYTIVREIDAILDTYPYHPYRQAFANPDLRRRLITYVLNRVNNQYATVDQDSALASDRMQSNLSFEQWKQLETCIHQGIQHLFYDHLDWIEHHVPDVDVDQAQLGPSHWFG
jgi:isocitrate lyase